MSPPGCGLVREVRISEDGHLDAAVPVMAGEGSCGAVCIVHFAATRILERVHVLSHFGILYLYQLGP